MKKLAMADFTHTLFFFGRLFLALFITFAFKQKYFNFQDTVANKILDKNFVKNWCRIRQERVDIYTKLRSCNFDISWNSSIDEENRSNLSTDASRSAITQFNINAAGEFSSFILQSRTRQGIDKTIGGDSWRILIRGRATIVPTIFDLSNGRYEVLFLIADPGVYKLEITLDYTLCDGFRDPPDDFFIKGDSQGKQQPNGILKGHGKGDYLLQKFQNGSQILINIALPRKEGLFLMHTTPNELHFDPTCGLSRCTYIWDGFGRWDNNIWRPYLAESNRRLSKNNEGKAKQQNYSTLLIYGDSQAERMHKSIQNSVICSKIFISCKVVKLWVYRFHSEKPENDDLDFSPEKLISIIKEDLQKPDIDRNSVVIFNLGLHYIMGISLNVYKKLLNDVVKLFNSDVFKGKVIWKTTTSINKEKDTDSYLFSDQKRFLNLPRIELFNSLSTKIMCDAGFDVLDVFPITRGFPSGTGGPEIGFYKEHDIVHYKNYVLQPVEQLLEQYFLGNVSYPISFSNYKFL